MKYITILSKPPINRCSVLRSIILLEKLPVRHVPVLDDGERIDDRSLLVDGNLLEVEMRPVVRLHARVAIVTAVQGAPLGDPADEWFAALLAAGRSRHQVDRGPRVAVRFLVRSVVDLRGGKGSEGRKRKDYFRYLTTCVDIQQGNISKGDRFPVIIHFGRGNISGEVTFSERIDL